MNTFCPFDHTWARIKAAVTNLDAYFRDQAELWVVRDLLGRIRLLLPEGYSKDENWQRNLSLLGSRLHEILGPRAWDPAKAIVPVDDDELVSLRANARCELVGNVNLFLIDRQVSASEWSSVTNQARNHKPTRLTLYSIKGGVGRSTTASALAYHWAKRGARVLVVDLDLESPGLGSILLTPDEQPDFGVVDWFVEDLVGQGEEVARRMIGRPSWAQDLVGDVLVVPAHGQDPGEYLAKLGRVHVNRPPSVAGQLGERWTHRLQRLMQSLEVQEEPDLVILDSRSGLHDLAAAAVTDVDAYVLLFAVDTPATWGGYRLLFQHWHTFGAAAAMRERLSLVAALVPETEQDLYLQRLREHAWDLFREYLYDEVPADASEAAKAEPFSFDLTDPEAPHTPVPIFWNRGLAHLSSLRDVDESVVTLSHAHLFARVEPLITS